MKSTLKRILVILTAAVLLLSLASCDKSGSIKKAFEKEEYTVTVYAGSDEKAQAVLTLMNLNEDQKKNIADYEIIVVNAPSDGGLLGIDLSTLTPDAIIVKFPSSGDLKDFLTIEKDDGTKDTSLYDKAVEAETIKGNCWFAMGDNDAKAIFNG